MIFELLMFVFMHIMLREPAQSAKPDLADGTRVVRYGWAYRFVPLASLALFGYVIFVALNIGVRNRRDVGQLGFFCVLVLLSAWCAIGTNSFRLILGEKAITARSAYRLPCELAWGEIAEVSYSSGAAAFVVKGERGEKILVPRMASGIGTFALECRSHLRFMTYLHASTEFNKIEMTL